MTVNSGPKQQASRYRRSIRGLRDQTGSGCHIYHTGVLVACHSAPPPPPEQYEAWLAQRPMDSRGKIIVTGAKLRRMVVMRRNGCGLAEIAQAVGLAAAKSARQWLDRLPPELAA